MTAPFPGIATTRPAVTNEQCMTGYVVTQAEIDDLEEQAAQVRNRIVELEQQLDIERVTLMQLTNDWHVLDAVMQMARSRAPQRKTEVA